MIKKMVIVFVSVFSTSINAAIVHQVLHTSSFLENPVDGDLNTIEMDLDGDLVVDFTFQHYYWYHASNQQCCGDEYAFGLSLGTPGGQAATEPFTILGPGTTRATPLSAGDVIDGSLSFVDSTSWDGAIITEYGNTTPVSFPGWSGEGGLLGVSFDIAGDTHFGWIRVVHESGNLVKIVDYAYEDQANMAIVAGVPVPAAVWLFGSGLIGLVGVARKKARV